MRRVDGAGRWSISSITAQTFFGRPSFNIRFLPWLPRIDQCRLDAGLVQPPQDRARDELRSVVRPQIARRAVDAHELRRDLNDAAGPNAASAGAAEGRVARRPLAADMERETAQSQMPDDPSGACDWRRLLLHDARSAGHASQPPRPSAPPRSLRWALLCALRRLCVRVSAAFLEWDSLSGSP